MPTQLQFTGITMVICDPAPNNKQQEILKNSISVESLKQSSGQLLEEKSIIAPLIPLLLGIIAIGFAPIFIKWSETEISPGAITFNRFWISSLVFGVWNGISLIRRHWSTIAGNRQQVTGNRGKKLDFQRNLPLPTCPSTGGCYNSASTFQQPYNYQVLGLLFVIGIAFSGKHLLWAWSLTQTSVTNSITIIYALIPPLSALGGWLLFQQRFEPQFLIGMTIAIVGAITIGLSDLSTSGNQVQGDLLALLSAVLSPFYFLTMEKLLTQFETKIIIFWCSTIGTLLTLPILVVIGDHLFPVSWQGWCSVIALALVCQIVGQGLIAYSLNFLSSGMVTITMLLDPVLSAILAWAILSEKITILNGISCFIVLFGIYLTIISKSASKSRPVS